MVRNIFISLVLLVLAIALSCGCAPTRYVSVNEVHNREAVDSSKMSSDRWRVDSVYISHVERIDGERVMVHDTLIRFQRVMVHDTLTRWREVVVSDSIPYPVEVVKEVRVRSAYDKFMARGFWLLLVTILLVLAIWIGGKTPQGRAVLSFVKMWL